MVHNITINFFLVENNIRTCGCMQCQVIGRPLLDSGFAILDAYTLPNGYTAYLLEKWTLTFISKIYL